MPRFELRCPRCKETFAAATADALTDAVLEHLLDVHGHAPPREHVIARVRRRDG